MVLFIIIIIICLRAVALYPKRAVMITSGYIVQNFLDDRPMLAHLHQPVAQGSGADNRDGWKTRFPVLLYISGPPAFVPKSDQMTA